VKEVFKGPRWRVLVAGVGEGKGTRWGLMQGRGQQGAGFCGEQGEQGGNRLALVSVAGGMKAGRAGREKA
jgi:hypothetical protein